MIIVGIIILAFIAFIAGMIAMDYMYYKKQNPGESYSYYVKQFFKRRFDS